MTWQDAAAYAIVAAGTLWAACRLRRFFVKKSSRCNGCNGCNGCPSCPKRH